MSASRQQNDPGRILWRRLALVGLLGLVVFGGWSVWGAWQKDQESAALNQQSQAALANLTTQQAQLQDNIADLQSERGKEAALRQEYAVGEPGEGMVVIVDPATTTAPPPSPSLIQKIEKAFTWW